MQERNKKFNFHLN